MRATGARAVPPRMAHLLHGTGCKYKTRPGLNDTLIAPE